jgi:hypothetical protein
MSRRRNIVLALLAFTGAYAAGRITTPDAPTPVPPERIVERASTRTIVQQAGASISLDDVRAVVREELAHVPAAQVVDAAPVIDEARLSRARSALDEGMVDGRWTEEDRERLRPLFASLPRAEGEQILSTLIPAFNAGRLRLEFHGSPI